MLWDDYFDSDTIYVCIHKSNRHCFLFPFSQVLLNFSFPSKLSLWWYRDVYFSMYCQEFSSNWSVLQSTTNKPKRITKFLQFSQSFFFNVRCSAWIIMNQLPSFTVWYTNLSATIQLVNYRIIILQNVNTLRITTNNRLKLNWIIYCFTINEIIICRLLQRKLCVSIRKLNWLMRRWKIEFTGFV